MSDLFVFIKFITCFCGSIFVLMGVLVLLYYAGEATIGKAECNSFQQITGIETRHNLLNGCFVNYEGNWYYYSVYKDVVAKNLNVKVD